MTQIAENKTTSPAAPRPRERAAGRGGPVRQTKKAGRHFEVNELSGSEERSLALSVSVCVSCDYSKS